MAVGITISCADWRTDLANPEALTRRAALRVLEGFELLRGRIIEVSVELTDDAAQQHLNRIHRGIDKPTNVLSFSGNLPGAGEPAEMPVLLGDIVLAHETVLREAAEQGKKPGDHLSHLIIHGMLHLLGHDHILPDDARIMEDLEIVMLADLGIDNPYEIAADTADSLPQNDFSEQRWEP